MYSYNQSYMHSFFPGSRACNKIHMSISGNGYLGASLYTKEKMYIYSRRALSVPIHFYPAVSVNIEGYESEGKLFTADEI